MNIGDHNLDPPDTTAQDHAAEVAHETCEQEMKQLRAYLRKRLAAFGPDDAIGLIQETRDNIVDACGEMDTNSTTAMLIELSDYDEAVEFLADTIAKGDKR